MAADKATQAFGRAIRGQFWLDPDVHFLNHGSFGATPRVVLQAQQDLQREMERQPVAFLMPLPERIREAIRAPASLLQCPPERLVFVENATSGVNAVLRTLRLAPDEAILTTDHAYGAVSNAIQYVCDRAGARRIDVPIPFPLQSPEQVLEPLERALDQDGIRLAVLDHITSKTGLVLPIGEMVARCRAAGVPVLVDAAHVPGHLPVDLASLGADYWVGNLHKWAFAPKGCAVLYAAEDAPPPDALTVSHGAFDGFVDAFDWPGTKDPSSWLAAPNALAFMDGLGVERMRAHNQALAREAADMLRSEWGTAAAAPPEMLANLVTLEPPIRLPPTLEAALALHDALLAEHGVEIPCMPFADRVWVRISAQVYNTLEDYEALLGAFRALSDRPF